MIMKYIYIRMMILEKHILSPELTDDVCDRIDAIKMEILGRDD